MSYRLYVIDSDNKEQKKKTMYKKSPKKLNNIEKYADSIKYFERQLQ